MKQCYKGIFYLLTTFLFSGLILKYYAIPINTKLAFKVPILDNLIINPEIQRNCTPVKSLIFAKTHKTGSSTLQNIFLRYGWKNNLTFVLPKAQTWMFSFKQKFEYSLAHQYKIGFQSSNIG